MHLASTAHQDPAWEDMPDRIETNARRVLETIVDRYHGVLVGPSPLARAMIEDEVMGHQSTLEALAALTAHGLIETRTHDDQPVFWVPNRLLAIPDRKAPSPRTSPIKLARRPRL